MPWPTIDDDALLDLERLCLADPAARLEALVGAALDDPCAWLQFCLCAALEAGTAVRGRRLADLSGQVVFKPDGSPATTWEHAVEVRLGERLERFAPGVPLVGEETGAALPAGGYALCVDPVDGTWALLGRTPSLATSVVLTRDGDPLLGVVLNPATGELGYGLANGRSRVVQLGLKGEPDTAAWLPLDRVGEALLLDLHPARAAGDLWLTLHRAWQRGEVGMVRGAGGSPSWALLEAAKGSFVYLNLWGKHPTQAFDLAAGVLLVRGAGGEVIDRAGDPIDPMTHQGLFVAGARRADRDAALALVREALEPPRSATP